MKALTFLCPLPWNHSGDIGQTRCGMWSSHWHPWLWVPVTKRQEPLDLVTGRSHVPRAISSNTECFKQSNLVMTWQSMTTTKVTFSQLFIHIDLSVVERHTWHNSISCCIFLQEETLYVVAGVNSLRFCLEGPRVEHLPILSAVKAALQAAKSCWTWSAWHECCVYFNTTIFRFHAAFVALLSHFQNVWEPRTHYLRNVWGPAS